MIFDDNTVVCYFLRLWHLLWSVYLGKWEGGLGYLGTSETLGVLREIEEWSGVLREIGEWPGVLREIGDDGGT